MSPVDSERTSPRPRVALLGDPSRRLAARLASVAEGLEIVPCETVPDDAQLIVVPVPAKADPAGRLAPALASGRPVLAWVPDEATGLRAIAFGADDYLLARETPTLPRLVRRVLARVQRSETTPSGLRDALLELLDTPRPERAPVLVQTLLERAVATTPGAQAGSVLQRGRDGRFRYLAVVGYDAAPLRGVSFSSGELGLPEDHDSYRARLLRDMARHWRRLDPERTALLEAANPRIAALVSVAVPVEIGGELAAALYLDGFDDSADRFDASVLDRAETAGAQLGLLLERLGQRRAQERTQRFGEVFGRTERLLLAFEDLQAFFQVLGGQLLSESYLPVDLLVLLRLDEDRLRPEFLAQRGGVPRAMPARVRTALTADLTDPDSIAAEVVRSGRPLYLPRVVDDPRWRPVPELLDARSAAWLPLRRRGRAWGVFAFVSSRADAFDDAARELLEQLARTAELALERDAYVGEMQATREATLRALGIALERRDVETKGHTDRVVELSQRLGERLGLERDTARALRWGAYLHDIGKLSVPDSILFKPSGLSPLEFEVIKRHADTGYELTLDIPFLPHETREVVRHHHERWDGGGYPDGLSGEAIPLLARIFSVVDCYDALTSRRSYKDAWSPRRALRTIRDDSGTAFDPAVVKAMVELFEAGVVTGSD